jgi:hypothetical protein
MNHVKGLFSLLKVTEYIVYRNILVPCCSTGCYQCLELTSAVLFKTVVRERKRNMG